MSARGSLALTAVVGLLAGAAGSLAVRSMSAGPTAPTVAASITAPAPPVAPSAIVHLHGVDPTVVADLQAKVKAVESVSAPSIPPRPPPAHLSQADGLAADRARFQADLAAHFSEAVDPTWAPATAKALTISVQEAAKAGGFTAGEVVCRDSSCHFVAEWPTFAEAAQQFKAIMAADLKVNCGRTVGLVDDPVPGQPYRTTVLLTCSTAKYGA